jgi:hypothetical protein
VVQTGQTTKKRQGRAALSSKGKIAKDEARCSKASIDSTVFNRWEEGKEIGGCGFFGCIEFIEGSIRQ